ncbi:hypothetical protein AB4254_08750 [Vibrio breoganii]
MQKILTSIIILASTALLSMNIYANDLANLISNSAVPSEQLEPSNPIPGGYNIRPHLELKNLRTGEIDVVNITSLRESQALDYLPDLPEAKRHFYHLRDQNHTPFEALYSSYTTVIAPLLQE